MGYPDYEEIRQCLLEEAEEGEATEGDDEIYDIKDDYEQTKEIRKQMLKLRKFPAGRKDK